MEEEAPPSPLRVFAEQCRSPLICILLVAFDQNMLTLLARSLSLATGLR